MSTYKGSALTEEEEFLLEKYRILREKKKLLQKFKEKAETKVKPAVKRELVPTASSTPEDAKKKAELLVASGCVKISKTSVDREFKRARISEKKGNKDSLSDQESATPVERKQTPLKAAMLETYNSNFVKSRQSNDDDSNHGGRGPRESRKGNTIFIKGYGLTEEIINAAFHKFGTVTDVRFDFDKERRCGTGFVTYKTSEAAAKAIEKMNGEQVSDVYLQVSYARKQFHYDRGNGPLWSSRDFRDRHEKPKDNRELQRYGDGDDFF